MRRSRRRLGAAAGWGGGVGGWGGGVTLKEKRETLASMNWGMEGGWVQEEQEGGRGAGGGAAEAAWFKLIEGCYCREGDKG